MMIYCYFSLVTILFSSAFSESTTESTENVLETYRSYINASLDLDRSDRLLMRHWSSDFLLQLVNVTSHYRLEMVRHRDHSFMGIKANPKWKDCMSLHQNQINKAETTYFSEESRCVNSANEKEDEKKQSVMQMEKEIRKWRKSYKYLSNQCYSNHPGEKDAAGECLVEYMQKDNYHITFQRLMLLKLESMSQLYSHILSSLAGLEACLKRVLSRYLSSVRVTMDNLNRCYKIKSLFK